jgi:hypothetical protein
MKHFAALILAFFLAQPLTNAEDYKPGDRVYIPILNKYGTVVEGGSRSPDGVFNPKVWLDEAKDRPEWASVMAGRLLKPAPANNKSNGSNTAAKPPVSPTAQYQSPQQTPTQTASGGKGYPPNGRYNCMKISSSGQLMHFGDLDIQGNTYRGLDTSGPFAPFTVSAGGTINWSAGLKGLEDVRITSCVYAGSDEHGRPLLYINYQATYSSDRIDCIRE